ncbi:metal-dependent hydrolase [Halovivax gelatinilyticus]|uniref:metal-dependent hydrolase n=1 Tax=Halovivax gelatinilyticus TaxID=2961597 RepID=UPI0020CA8275|nr:metal-dependent hydrolase [Halovivax gelatinilyticus]
MWPWEHVIIGYLAYSLFCHLFLRDSPGGLETIAVVFASVLPDLIDKPLAWEYGVFESGYALGHSIFFAIPLSIAIGLLARRFGRTRAGIAFGIGYLLHLPADVVDGYVRGGVYDPGILLWPVERGVDFGHGQGFQDQFLHHFGQYRAELSAGDPSTYVLAQVGLSVLVVCVWLYDGAPVLRESIIGGKRLGESLRSAIEREPSRE